ncbi:MAG: hypothetical protein ABI200_03050 [Gaiellales bacterium]
MQISAGTLSAAVAPPSPAAMTVSPPEPPSRPTDVIAARESWRPNLGTLGADDARRAQNLVQRAAAGLASPYVIVNRNPAEAVALLEGSLTRLSTAHDKRTNPDDPRTPKNKAAAMRRRTKLEQRHGTLGEGAARGTTTYGTVAWDRSMPHKNGRVVPQLGAWRYGQAALVLKGDVLDRATFLPHDSVSVAPGTRTSAREQLIDVAVERLARDFGFVDDLGHGGRPAPHIPEHTRLARQQRLLDILHARDDAALTAMRRELQTMPTNDRYVEAQIRGGVTVADIAEIRIADRPEMIPVWARTPEMHQATAAAIDALEGAAKLHDIPVLRVR